jgi:hypothetical protein
MIKILEEVAAQRQLMNDENYTIQLSSTFMRKAVDSINKLIGEEKIKQNENMNEFKYVFFNKEYTIRNRAYRDDTNDEDVEEAVFKFICL